MNKNIIMISILALALLVFLGLVFAAPKDAAQNNTANTSNMTFSACMKKIVDTKGTCYDVAKSAKASCDAAALNSSKGGVKTCNPEYKKEKSACKADFKKSKKEMCQPIKHTTWEGFKASFA